MGSTEVGLLEKVPTELYVAGEWRPSSDGGQLAVEDPSTGDVLCEVADATVDDGVDALDAAVAAQEEWAATPPQHRGEILRRAYEIIMERSDELGLLITLEMGKTLDEAKAEIAYGAGFFRWFAEEATRIGGRYSPSPNGDGRILTLKQPVGPCLLITPWNFPLAMGTRKIGPAVAAGCTMVVKPAQKTPLSMLMLVSILEEAGLPPGVCNVITPSSSGAVMEPLIRDPRVRKLSFTGSTAVGRKLLEQAADQVLRVSMELGGNAPFVILDDADLDAALDGAVVAKMRNMGESCIAANRFLVHEALAEPFADRLAERFRTLVVGRGTEQEVDVGPMIDEPARAGIHDLVGDARGRGAEVLVGGGIPERAGYFYPPTVLSGVPDDAEMVDTEIFGPVAPILTFSDENEAVARANDTPYGLVAYLYTNDVKRALRVSEALEAGMVGLNRGLVSNPAAPFGGVKHSGLGREGGEEGIEEYLETKYIAVDT